MPSGSPKWRAVGIFWGVGDEKVIFSGVIAIWDLHKTEFTVVTVSTCKIFQAVKCIDGFQILGG